MTQHHERANNTHTFTHIRHDNMGNLVLAGPAHSLKKALVSLDPVARCSNVAAHIGAVTARSPPRLPFSSFSALRPAPKVIYVTDGRDSHARAPQGDDISVAHPTDLWRMTNDRCGGVDREARSRTCSETRGSRKSLPGPLTLYRVSERVFLVLNLLACCNFRHGGFYFLFCFNLHCLMADRRDRLLM